MSSGFSYVDSSSDSNYDTTAQENDSGEEEAVGEEEDVAGGASSEEVSSEEGKAENDHDENTAMTTVSRQSTRKIWKQNYYCVDIAPAQLTEHYKALAIQHFGGGGTWGLLVEQDSLD